MVRDASDDQKLKSLGQPVGSTSAASGRSSRTSSSTRGQKSGRSGSGFTLSNFNKRGSKPGSSNRGSSCGNTNKHWTQSKTFRQGWTTRAWQCKQCKLNANTENEHEEVLEAVEQFPFHKCSEYELGTEDEDDEASEEEEDEEDETKDDDDKKEDEILDGISQKTDVQQCSQGGKVKNMKLELKNETEKVASQPSRRKRRHKAEKEKKLMAKKLKEN